MAGPGVGAIRQKARSDDPERASVRLWMDEKIPAYAGIFSKLAERTGLAHIPQAAVAQACATLRVPPEAAQAASSTPHTDEKIPACAGIFSKLAERTGLAHIPRAAVAQVCATLRVPPEAAQAASSTPHTDEKMPACAGIFPKLAERTGLEPATPGVTGRYSNQLNYRSSFLATRWAIRLHRYIARISNDAENLGVP
jgi:hypothetical protein